MAPTYPEKLLKVGDSIPDFHAVSLLGESINRASLLGKKTWLIFYRYARCPLCVYHLHLVQGIYEELARSGIQVLAVFESKPKRFPAKVRSPEGWKFPLIPDPTKELYEVFRVPRGTVGGVLHPRTALMFLKAHLHGHFQGGMDGQLTQVPAHFLIDRECRVFNVHYGKHLADHLPMIALRPFVKLA